MKSIASRGLVVACGLALFAGSLPAAARDFVLDQAGMFSGATLAQLNERIGAFNAQTHKEIVVVTTPSLGGATLQNAAASAFAQQNVNGVLIFIARDDRRDIIVPDRAGVQAGWFTPDVLRSIRIAMEAQFKAEAYDAGITGAVDAILRIYQSHLRGLQTTGSTGAVPAERSPSSTGGFHIPMFWLIIIVIVGFLILRSILRAFSAPRYYGGRGSFWSGLLGGLGGAWLGNELFRGGGGLGPTQAGQITPDSGGGLGGADTAGWQGDAGQADMSGASGGDWGGGGFGDSGGGGDLSGGGDGGGGW
jgi:uncharacterized protein